MIDESNADLLRSDWGRKIHDLAKSGDQVGGFRMWGEAIFAKEDPLAEFENLTRSMWEQVTSAAEAHNQPGTFTALIGYEWTSMPNNGSKLHWNVIFRDGQVVGGGEKPGDAYDLRITAGSAALDEMIRSSPGSTV